MTEDGWAGYWQARDCGAEVVPSELEHGAGPWPPAAPPADVTVEECG